jgi:hypothetical protein
MQLPLSADVLVPIGVGVLVAVVAVIVLVTGLRRRADDVSAPTDDDWTGERVGEVVAAPTRTVADAVAARQGNSDPFLVVSPAQPRAAGEQNGAKRVVPLGAVVPGVSAPVTGVEHARHAAPRGVRTAVVAADAASAERAAPVAVADGPQPTGGGATEPAGGPERDGGAAFPADPLFGAGRFDQVGPDGDPWFTPPSLPRTPPVSPPAEPEETEEGELDTGAVEPGPTAAWPFDQRPASESAPTPGEASGPTPGSPAGRPFARPVPPDGSSPAAEAAPPGPQPPAAGIPHPATAESAATTTARAPSGAPRLAARGGVGAAGPSAAQPAVGGGGAAAGGALSGGPAEAAAAGPSGAPHPAVGGSAAAAGAAPSGGPASGSSPSDAPHPAPDGGTPTPVIPVRSADGHPVEAGPAAGSSHSVAAAVAQVLAARAAAQAPDADRRGDARDRLLAVLLDDPLRAVGAAVDLQDCQERIDRLTATLGDERGRLGDVLGRLACSGLRADQLARLSGLSDVEVAELLRRASDA